MAINPHWDEGNTPPAGTITDYDLGKGGRSTLGINKGGSQYDVPSWYFDPVREGSTNDYSRWTGMHHGALQPAGGPTGIETAVPYFEQRNLFSGPNYRGEPERYNPNFFKDMLKRSSQKLMLEQLGKFPKRESGIMIKEREDEKQQRKYLESIQDDNMLYPDISIEFGDSDLLGMTGEFGDPDLLGMTGEVDMTQAASADAIDKLKAQGIPDETIIQIFGKDAFDIWNESNFPIGYSTETSNLENFDYYHYRRNGYTHDETMQILEEQGLV